jgi:hypothetical protein
MIGAVTKPILSKDRYWLGHLPQKEIQIGKYQETWACVTFSALNCLEILFRCQYEKEINASDRFTAKMSGTVEGVGNTFVRVADSIRHDGLLPERFYPWARNSQEEFYIEIPEYYGVEKPSVSLKKYASILVQNYDIRYEWVGWNGLTRDQLWDALQYAPVQITVSAWKKPNLDGVYSYVDKNTNHAVTAVAMDSKGQVTVFDHYEKTTKILSKDFYIGSGMIYSISKKFNPFSLVSNLTLKYDF